MTNSDAAELARLRKALDAEILARNKFEEAVKNREEDRRTTIQMYTIMLVAVFLIFVALTWMGVFPSCPEGTARVLALGWPGGPVCVTPQASL